MRPRTLSFVIVCMFGAAGPALAQPSAWSAPPPAEPAQATSSAPSKFSLGLQFIGGDLNDPDNELEVATLGGYGMFVRYRLGKHLELEVAFDKVHADMSNNRVRELRPMTGSVLLHLFQRGQFSGYLRGGLGKAKETYSSERSSAEFEDKLGHFGAGAEYRLRSGKLGVVMELRSSTVARVFADGSSWKTQGGELRLGAAYHF